MNENEEPVLATPKVLEEEQKAFDELKKKSFLRKLESLINGNCKENGSNTPDFILAEFLANVLAIFDAAVNDRSKWYGRFDKPGQSLVLVERQTLETIRSCVETAVDELRDDSGDELKQQLFDARNAIDKLPLKKCGDENAT